MKSTFEYFSFAHFIDIVLVVQIIFDPGKLYVYVVDEDEEFRGFYEEEEEDKWLIQNEFGYNFSFKISLPPAPRICGFNLFARYSVTSGYRRHSYVDLEIRNNTSGRSLRRQAFVSASSSTEYQSLSHLKLGGNDPTFDNGDDVSISLLPHDAAIQARTIGVRWLHEEEGKDDDDDDDAAHVARVEIASLIFRNYYCAFHANLKGGNRGWWHFAKRGLELARYPK